MLIHPPLSIISNIAHSTVGVCTLIYGILGLCALSYRVSTYVMTQNIDFYFRAISHTSLIMHIPLNYLELSSIYIIPWFVDHG